MTTTAPAPQMATDKQVTFVRRLLAEKNLGMIPALAAQITQGLDDGLTRQAASAAIDAMIGLPRAPLTHADGNAVGEGYYVLNGDVYKVQAAKTGGNLYAKKFTVNQPECPGHYAEVPAAWDAPKVYCEGDDGTSCQAPWAGYVYAPGAMPLLAGAARLTLAQAADIGVATGTCVVCGRVLTDSKSVTAGIGPVCAKRL